MDRCSPCCSPAVLCGSCVSNPVSYTRHCFGEIVLRQQCRCLSLLGAPQMQPIAPSLRGSTRACTCLFDPGLCLHCPYTPPLARERPTPAQNGKPIDPQISETTLPSPLGGGDGAAAGLGELVGLMPDFRVNFARGAAGPPRHGHLDEQHAALDDGLRRHVLCSLVPTLQVSGHGGILANFVVECWSSLQNCFFSRSTYSTCAREAAEGIDETNSSSYRVAGCRPSHVTPTPVAPLCWRKTIVNGEIMKPFLYDLMWARITFRWVNTQHLRYIAVSSYFPHAPQD